MTDTKGTATNLQLERLELGAGTVVFYQGEPSDHLYILRSGELEALITEGDVQHLTPEQMILGSRRVAMIDTPGPFGELGFLLKQPRSATVRAVSACQLTRLPADLHTLDYLFEKDPRIALQLGRTILKRYNKTRYQLRETDSILRTAQRLWDNGSLLLLHTINRIHMVLGISEYTLPTTRNRHLDQALNRMMIMRRKHIRLPLDLRTQWISRDLSKLFDEQYGLVSPDEDRYLSGDLVKIFEMLLHDSSTAFLDVIATSPGIMRHMCRYLGAVLPSLNAEVLRGRRAAEREIRFLAGARDSLLVMLYEEATKDRNEPNILEETNFLDRLFRALWDETETLASRYLELWGEPLRNLFDGARVYAELQPLSEVPLVTDEGTMVAAPAFTVAASAVAEPVEQAAAAPPPAHSEQHEHCVARYLALADPATDTAETRKLKKELAAFYWQAYEENFLRTEGVTPESRLLLRYGMLDDRLISDAAIAHLQSVSPGAEQGWHIYYADEWLNRVYNGLERPSVTENGKTFQEFREEAGLSEELEDVDQAMLEYEIQQVLRSGVRMANFGMGSAPPFLADAFMPKNLERAAVTRGRLRETLEMITALDYSVFHREVRMVEGDTVSFVQKEVRPVFILLPAAGDRCLCWQELDGNNKNKAGRILVPAIFRGDLHNALLDALGRYRWELQRTCAGYRWSDPVDGGLTGKYYDYVCNYDKDQELSASEKAGIKAIFRRNPSTTDKFVYDYLLWMKYEKDGGLKLNKLNRKIFFQYVPFVKAVRDRLGQRPAYQKCYAIDHKERVRMLKRVAAQIRKLKKQGQPVPALLLKQEAYYES